MKLFFFVLICCFSNHASMHAVEPAAPELFNVHKKRWAWSQDFELTQKGHLIGKVKKKTLMRPQTHYELYDATGQYQAEGICRLLTLGLFFTWATEIDIYDQNGDAIGYIDGQVGSFQAARFSIYDHGKLTAIAFLDANFTGFTVVDAETQEVLLARLSRNFRWDTIDDWTVEVYDPTAISPEIIRIFAAFAVDSQKDFKPDR